MVSRVYTPLVPAYTRPQQAGQSRGPVSFPAEEEKQAFQAPPSEQPGIHPELNDSRRPSAGLQAVQVDRFQKIPLDAVLHDFRNTMNALGADDQTRAEVDTYLRVVSLQGSKEQPEVPFIKHTLRTAAGALDQYIAGALGQPSKVVKEWVDALLLQDIDYHSDLPPGASQASANAGSAISADASTAHSQATVGLSTSDKAQIKTLIEQARNNPGPDADRQLQDALDLLQDGQHPDWEGKIWQLRGRLQEKTGDWQQAVHCYQTAAQKFADADLPARQASSLHAMASTYEDHGQLEQARQAYQQVLALDTQAGDRQSKIRSLNDLGRLSLRQGDGSGAVETLQQAATELNNGDFSPALRSDVLSNLGAAYRSQKQPDLAEDAYRQSLQEAKTARDKSRYTTSLQQLAALYVEANRPADAMKALQRLSQLNPNPQTLAQ